MLLIILLVKSKGSGGWNCISTVCNTFCSHWSLSMELFWNLVCDNLRVPYLASLRSKDTTFNGFTFNVMAAGLIFNGTSKLHCRTNSRPFGWIAVFTLDAPWQVYWRCNIFASSQFYFIWYYPAGSLLIITSLLCCLDNYYQALYCICIYIQLYMGYDVWHIVSCQTFSWISTGITISAVLPHLWHYIILNTSNMSFLSRLRGKCIQLLTRLIHGPLLNLQRLDISGVYVSIGDSWRHQRARGCVDIIGW